MDAVHLMRAVTGRDLIIKVEGCYHGHHDSVQVSVLPEADETARPNSRIGGRQQRHPHQIRDLVSGGRVQRPGRRRARAQRASGRGRGMILEPIMMNAGIILPDDGYLAGAPGPAAPTRRAADVRRGQDRADHRPGWRDRAVRRHP